MDAGAAGEIECAARIVSSLSGGWPRSVREAVDGETPARRASEWRAGPDLAGLGRCGDSGRHASRATTGFEKRGGVLDALAQ